MSEQKPYRVLEYNELEGRFDDRYDVLVGPSDFECMLGEPEDRTWGRDGKNVVARLNEQHAEIKRLQGVLDQLLNALDSIGYDPGCGCSPCMGACVCNEALRITIDEMRSEACEAAKKARNQ